MYPPSVPNAIDQNYHNHQYLFLTPQSLLQVQRFHSMPHSQQINSLSVHYAYIQQLVEALHSFSINEPPEHDQDEASKLVANGQERVGAGECRRK